MFVLAEISDKMSTVLGLWGFMAVVSACLPLCAVTVVVLFWPRLVSVGHCRKCGYVLDGLSEYRCPECGRSFDPTNGRTFCHHGFGKLKTAKVTVIFVIIASLCSYLGGYGYLRVTHQYVHYVGWEDVPGAPQASTLHAVRMWETYRCPSFEYYPIQSIIYVIYYPLAELEESLWRVLKPRVNKTGALFSYRKNGVSKGRALREPKRSLIGTENGTGSSLAAGIPRGFCDL
jgi:hypothetical protein